MIARQPAFSSIGALDVSFARKHVNFGPAPDLVILQFRAVGGAVAGSALRGAVLAAGSETCEFRRRHRARRSDARTPATA